MYSGGICVNLICVPYSKFPTNALSTFFASYCLCFLTILMKFMSPLCSSKDLEFTSISPANLWYASIPNAFSPDGDGINDTWNIRGGLYNYPNNNLLIFNRWGLKVYEADGYNNNWDGTNNGNSNSGNDSKLPVGTYYYVLDLNGNAKNVKKGFIYLTRINE